MIYTNWRYEKAGNVCRGVHFLSWSEGNRYNEYSEAVSEILLAQAPLKHCGKGECYGKIRSNNDYYYYFLLIYFF